MKKYKQFISENLLNEREIYLYKEIKYFVEWFTEKYRKVANFDGWDIFNSDTDVPREKYISNDKYNNFFQVQRLDDEEILDSDNEADILAKEIGIILDPYNFGLVLGFNNIDFLDHPEKIRDACYINPVMKKKIKEWKIKMDANKYNL